jgi:transposase InsO family protein
MLICRMRREHPRWGARRIVHELGQRGVAPVPGRATVHRVLVRNGMVKPQEQQHKRQSRRWQRDAPMQLWQLDIVGGVPLADGREAKLVTGIDDHSRFVVIAVPLCVLIWHAGLARIPPARIRPVLFGLGWPARPGRCR